MQENYENIQTAGAELFAISSENIETTKKTVENIGLSFPVLADEDKTVINAYNVLDQTNTSIARPAAFIVSTDGKIAWKSIDAQNTRVPTATILTELGKL